MLSAGGRRTAGSRDERGAAAVLVALVTCFVLFLVAALTVDMGNTWSRRGQLQFQVDRAAKFAAERLPVDTTVVGANPTDSQLAVAKAAAYYLACHLVPGETAMSTLPACPAASAFSIDVGIDSWARALLSNGRGATSSTVGSISFPATNKVRLSTPDAKVEFGFAKIMGKDGSVQAKSSTAVVLSPGQIVPVGMSLGCLANSLGAAPLGGGDTVSTVMPINYVSSGYTGQAASGTPITYDTTAADFSDITQGNSASITLNTAPGGMTTPTTRNALTGAVTLSFNWAQTKNGYTPYKMTIYIRKAGYVVGNSTGSYVKSPAIASYVWDPILHTVTALPPLPNPYSFSLTIPAGNYEALIQLEGVNQSSGALQTWASGTTAKFTVLPEPAPGDLQNFVSCARPMQSPRLGLSTDSAAMVVNLAQGLDHGLAAFPGLGDAVDAVNISPGTSVSNVSTLLSGPSSVFTCANNSSVKLDYPTRRTDDPNCIHVDTSQDWSVELTQGLLTGGSFATGSVTGRLKCPATGACNYSATRAVLTNPGGIPGSYNGDHFSDFILKAANGSPRYLSDPFFMSLDAFISPSLPLVTPPNDTLDTALYSSPRFFWAPVAVTAYTTKAAGDYPVMTFRPVFLTSDSSSQITTPIDMLLLGLVTQSTANGLTLAETLTKFGQSAACILSPTVCELALLKLADISGPLTSLTGSGTVTVGGLVIDTAALRVRAARIMTLAPGALPAVPKNYSGPTTDYLGVGPKIVRLTQ